MLAAPREISTLTPAEAVMVRESRVRRAPVNAVLGGHEVLAGQHALVGDAFLLHSATAIRIAYVRGQGVVLDAPDSADPGEIDLWLNGTVYAAIAAINGLMPLHASAVAHKGRVYAFTGPPGAGKSTLAAALGHAGFPLFCDDTLILDPTGEGAFLCLPGHKRLKLWPEGAALAGAEPQEQVSRDYPKHFATPAGGSVGHALPLAALIFLEQAPELALCAAQPGQRIARLQDDHYTARLFAMAGALDRPERFAQLANIAGRLPMRRFARPFSRDGFAASLGFIAEHIRAGMK